MHRQPDHVMAFLLAELGTSGSLDGQQRLVVKGRFAPKNFEGILRRYVSKWPLIDLLPAICLPNVTLIQNGHFLFCQFVLLAGEGDMKFIEY